MNRHTILVVVDMQNDFLEGGKLPVQGATKAKDAIIELLETRVQGEDGKWNPFIEEVIFTADWHPGNHCSFKSRSEKGTWPVHCVEYTAGAAIADPLIDTCVQQGIPYGVICKGQHKDEENYTALRYVMKNKDLYSFSMAPDFNPTGNIIDFWKDEEDDGEWDEIFVCGVAGDVCVLNTLKELLPVNPIVFTEGTASIDNKVLRAFIEEKGLDELVKNTQYVHGSPSEGKWCISGKGSV